MINILGHHVAFPGHLEFFESQFGSFVATVAAWTIIGLLLYLVLTVVAKWFAQKSKTDIDDVILSLSAVPWVVTALLIGGVNAIGVFTLGQVSGGKLVPSAFIVDRLLRIAIVGTVAFWVWRMFRQVVVYYGRRYAERTESSVDDVLVPIADQIGPIVICVVALGIALQMLGVNVAVVVTAIGGAAFIMAFALQDILSNVFSGLSLLTDSPFKYGDLVALEDGTVCEVKKIGLRVTQLYNISKHSVIYMPNSKLANERLVNITKPSPDLITTIGIGVGYNSSVPLVKELLDNAANGHPDVLGDIKTKTDCIRKRIAAEQTRRDHGEKLDERLVAKLTNGIRRLELELLVDERVGDIRQQLRCLVDRIRSLEEGGLAHKELSQLVAQYQPIQSAIGDTRDEPGSPTLFGRVREWVAFRASDPDVEPFPDDAADFGRRWEQTFQHLTRRIQALSGSIAKPGDEEQRLDDRVTEFEHWLTHDFKEKTPKWKCPDINFLNFGESSLDFEIQMFVDDIRLEHFERESRVATEVREEIIMLLRAAGIEMPFPQRDVRFRNAVEVGRRKSERE